MSNVQDNSRDVTPENGVELEAVSHVSAGSAGPPSSPLTAARRFALGADELGESARRVNFNEEDCERWDGQG